MKFGTRYYDPTTARWTQQDPERGEIDQPITLNPYLYGLDDPINNVDASGRIPAAVVIIGSAFIYWGAEKALNKMGVSPEGSSGGAGCIGGAAAVLLVDPRARGLATLGCLAWGAANYDSSRN